MWPSLRGFKAFCDEFDSTKYFLTFFNLRQPTTSTAHSPSLMRRYPRYRTRRFMYYDPKAEKISASRVGTDDGVLSPSSLPLRVGDADDHETTGDHDGEAQLSSRRMNSSAVSSRKSHPEQLKTKNGKDNDYCNRMGDGTDTEPLSTMDQKDKMNDRDGSCGNGDTDDKEAEEDAGGVEDTDVEDESSDTDTDEEDPRHVLTGFGERESPEDGFVVCAVSPLFECSELGVLRRAAVPARKYYGLNSPTSQVLRHHIKAKRSGSGRTSLSAEEEFQRLFEAYKTSKTKIHSRNNSLGSPASSPTSISVKSVFGASSNGDSSMNKRGPNADDASLPEDSMDFSPSRSSIQSRMSMAASSPPRGHGPSIRNGDLQESGYALDNTSSPTKSSPLSGHNSKGMKRQSSVRSVPSSPGGASACYSNGMGSPLGGKRKRKDVRYSDAPKLLDFGPLQHLPKAPRRDELWF